MNTCTCTMSALLTVVLVVYGLRAIFAITALVCTIVDWAKGCAR